MQPGLTRAVPMGIVGFLAGAALVLLLRALQSMDPLWDAEIGIIGAMLFSTIFFLWGMGAFSREYAQHHVEAYYDDDRGEIVVEGLHHEDDEHHAPEPRRLLSGQVWQIAFWSVVLFAFLFAVTSLPFSPALTISNDPGANANTIGYFTMQIGEREIVVSQLVAFLIFTGITIGTLALVGGLIGSVVYGLSREVAVVKAAGNVPLNALPAASTAGLLPSGEAGDAVTTAPVRSASNRARAFVAPNMAYFALVYPNVVLALMTFGINGDNVVTQLFLAALISLVLTLLLLNLFPGDPARAKELAPAKVLGVGALVFALLMAILTVIVNLSIQVADWLYVPAEPVQGNLPVLMSVFLTPFILDTIFNNSRSLAEKARFVVIPAVLFAVLYIIFYGAAIGLVFATEPLRTMMTAVNVAVIILLLLHTGEVLWVLGKAAGWAARLLRGLPHFLGQR
jgi:hypothetical protein